MSETIKHFVFLARTDGLTAEATWRAAQARFPRKCVSWGYIRRLRKMFDEGDRIDLAKLLDGETV